MDDLASVVRRRLARYIEAELKEEFEGLQVWEYWPIAGQPLPPFCVTVLQNGQPETDEFPPVPMSSVDVAGSDPALVHVTYVYGRAEIPFQISAWASSPVGQRQLGGAIQNAMNRPVKDTVPGAPGLRKPNRSPGVVLRLDDYHGQLCAFRMSPLFVPQESAIAAQVGEWRATWSGACDVAITDRQTVVRLTNLGIKLKAQDRIFETVVVPPPEE